MTQNKLRVFYLIGTLVMAVVLAVGFSVSAATTNPNYKEYRNGSAVAIKGKTYLLATNNSSVEILSFNRDNALVLEAELRLPQKIKDVVTTNEGDEAYAIVTTGRYLYRVRITNPKNLEVVLRHDNFQYSRGRTRTGNIDSLATNGKALFTAGQYGVRRINLVNLQVEKYVYYDKAYGVAVNNNFIYVLGEQKAYAFNLVNFKKVMEADIKNVDKLNRRIAIGKYNAGYVISDNSVIKMLNGEVTTYKNPVKTVNFSYAAAATNNEIYYVNGIGVTKLDVNLKKLGYFTTAQPKTFGERSFAVGVMVVNANGGDKVVVMNKSNIVVMSPNLAVLSKYKNNDNLQPASGFTIVHDHLYFMTNQAISARITGLYPNEKVKLTIGGKAFYTKSSNTGEAIISFVTPSNPKRYTLEVSAASLASNYQETREVH